MKIIRAKSTLNDDVLKLKAAGKSIGFVPTMGFLHEGHVSLVKRARAENEIVIVSIYVNPLQFGPNEDFKKYPRDEKSDLEMLEKEKVDFVFLPGQKDFSDLKKIIPPGQLTNCLCGKSRPGHFAGVATIVKAFFEIIEPDRAYFGQKDYQQCLIIKWLAATFFPKMKLPAQIKIVMCPIVREVDGLAMSSRNSYLSPEQRLLAPLLFQALQNLKKNPGSLPRIITELERYPAIKVDYLELRDAEKNSSGRIIIAGAIYVGNTRIIDNILD